jgi:hypothetical protein
MMAEMIASYSAPGATTGTAAAAPVSTGASPTATGPASANGGGYLNEVSHLTARAAPGEQREA